ncbi:MAG: AAA family ATPase [Alphaproteobacteria bacterium]|nr:AAA family ATPase [Alphaproteobacteria bacterium]MCB9698443.1 AAA family ATPase [Alphaproteobacteria bacterium]
MARVRSAAIGSAPGQDHVVYGDRLGPAGLARTLGRLLDTNVRRVERGGATVPICVWGVHGIGKTAIVQQVCEARGWAFGYVAPAQFEEMGDLHGLPVLDTDGGGPRTRFAAPDWVPREPGPGVLLFDDLNRADDRILRGVMQLFQTGRMFSWELPPGWQIVATANPEGGSYSVTSMDDAMLTRMLHLTLELDVAEWAAWAKERGIDRRGVDFVLAYPEVVTGRRTTPRSLVQFFETLTDIEDLRAEEALVRTLAASTLDEVTVASFLGWVRGSEVDALTPEEVLDAQDPGALEGRMRRMIGGDGGEVRLDRLGTLCSRLQEHLLAAGYEPGERHGENLERFLLHPLMPADLRMAFHRTVMSSKRDAAKELLRRKAIAERILDAL